MFDFEIFSMGLGFGFLLAIAVGGGAWQINRIWSAWKMFTKF
jgi:hypothetical protein